MHSASSFEDLIPHMKRAGFFAASLAAIITAKFGFSLGEDFVASCAIAGLLALATFIVAYALVAAHKAWQVGKPGIAGAAALLFTVAVSVEFLSHAGFTASNRDATLQAANLQTIAFEDQRKAVSDAEARLDRLRADREALEPIAGVANVKPWRNPADAKGAVQTAEAHRFYRTTQGCSVTKGPQTRDFCEKYNMAKAEVERWKLIAEKEIQIGAAEQAVTDARKTANLQKTGHSSGGSQGAIFAAVATGSQAPDQAAVFWSGVAISSLIALFAVCASGLLNLIAFAFDPPRAAQATVQALAQAVDKGRDVVNVQTRTVADLIKASHGSGTALVA